MVLHLWRSRSLWLCESVEHVTIDLEFERASFRIAITSNIRSVRRDLWPFQTSFSARVRSALLDPTSRHTVATQRQTAYNLISRMSQDQVCPQIPGPKERRNTRSSYKMPERKKMRRRIGSTVAIIALRQVPKAKRSNSKSKTFVNVRTTGGKGRRRS